MVNEKPHGIELITKERDRQIQKRGYTPDHDRNHIKGEIALAAICYASPRRVYVKNRVPVRCGCRSVGECPHGFGKAKYMDPWPWDEQDDKRDSAPGHPDKKASNATIDKWQRIRNLVKAGALIAAEIDRLQAMDDSAYKYIQKEVHILSILE